MIHPQVSDNCFSFFSLILIHPVSILLNITQDQFFLFPVKTCQSPFITFCQLSSRSLLKTNDALLPPLLHPIFQVCYGDRWPLHQGVCLRPSSTHSASLIYGRNQANQSPPGLPSQLGSKVSHIPCAKSLFSTLDLERFPYTT